MRVSCKQMRVLRVFLYVSWVLNVGEANRDMQRANDVKNISGWVKRLRMQERKALYTTRISKQIKNGDIVGARIAIGPSDN